MAKRTGAEYDIRQEWPEQFLTQDMDAVLEEVNKIIKELRQNVVDFINLIDANLIREDLIDAAVFDKGFDVAVDFPEIPLSIQDKRKLIFLAVEIYRSKGTGPGMVNVVFLLLQKVIEFDFLNTTSWKLGVNGRSELGETTRLRTNQDKNRWVYSFNVRAIDPVTPEEKKHIISIINYMKPAHTHLIRFLEDEVINHWQLGRSQLGVNTLVHESP